MTQVQPSENATNGHRWSHSHLISRVPYYLPSHPRVDLSGILVPTNRRLGVSSGMALAIRLAEAKGAQLLVVRSGEASRQPFPQAMAPRTGVATAVLDLPAGAERILPRFPSNEHVVATLHRNNDLGLKRNIGLLIGRMCGWSSMIFLDDDIRTTPASAGPVGPGATRSDRRFRLGDVLAEFENSPDVQAAGYFQCDFDDNSVVCHARRLVGRPQETFISGGALVVRCPGPLPMFSSAYNEDWLFFLHLMLNGRHTCPSSAVKYVGTVHQDEYYPFTVPRAESEELGDLLAEGLFNLVGERREDLLATASSPGYWQQAIDSRCQMITELLGDLYRPQIGTGAVVIDARRALHAALNVYSRSMIDTAASLAEFFTTFLCDLDDWAALLASVTPASEADVLTLDQALAVLGLSQHVTWCGTQRREPTAVIPRPRVVPTPQSA